MFLQDSYVARAPTTLEPLSSVRDVTYSCGYCGYALNLSSSNRNTTNITSKYGKTIKKGVVSFVLIDETRFSRSEEFSCLPYFTSKHSWGLFRRRTKLLCGKCNSYIGFAYEDGSPSAGPGSSDSRYGNGVAASKKYNIRINAIQPSSDEAGTPLFIR